MNVHTITFLCLSMFLLFEGNRNSDCTRKVCLSIVAGKSQLKLICDVPNLNRQIIFYDPNSAEYARCILPFPTPICFTKHSNSEIVQNINTNQTILIINSSKITDLNGIWFCSHGSDGDKESVDVEVPEYMPDDKCSSCWKYTLITTCATFIITAGTFLICTKFLSLRRIPERFLSSTVFRVFQSLKAIKKRNQVRANSYEKNKMECLEELNEIGYATTHSRCLNCSKETSFAFCFGCQKFYCETCATIHTYKLRFRKHTLIQTNHFPYVNHNIMCNSCQKRDPEVVCKICEIVLCTTCSCPHYNDKDILKQLLPPSSPIVPTTRSRNQDHSEVLRKSYTVTVSNEKYVTRIRGIAYLKSGSFALADYRNKQLKVFSEHKLVFEKYFGMEPRGLTGISGNKIAVTFAYEKKIIFYEVNNSGATENAVFDLKHIGKPFEIAHHKDNFIVEINEGVDGCIVILDSNGDKKFQIENDNWKFGYFTGNTIRLQLDIDKKEFYVAAIGKQAVYCLDFKGNVKWLVKVPSPRSIAKIPHTKDTTLLFASHKSSAIYKLICEERKESERYKPALIEMEAVDENEFEEDEIKLPEYISYDHKNCLLYTEVANGHVSVYHLETK